MSPEPPVTNATLSRSSMSFSRSITVLTHFQLLALASFAGQWPLRRNLNCAVDDTIPTVANDVGANRHHSLHGPVLRIRSPSATLASTCRWRSRPQHQKQTSSRPAIYRWKLLFPLWTVWAAPTGRP